MGREFQLEDFGADLALSPGSMPPDCAQLVQWLCDLRAGRLDCGEARTRIETRAGFQFPKSEFVLSFMDHYLHDEDIRRSDPGYEAMQNRELDKLISRLQQSDYDGAAKVTFLKVS